MGGEGLEGPPFRVGIGPPKGLIRHGVLQAQRPRIAFGSRLHVVWSLTAPGTQLIRY